jgi:predicted DNA-binding transcriptional regulator AlpA
MQRGPGNDAVRDLDLRDDPLWDARDVARYLKKSLSWVYHAAAADEVPCRRIGGSLRFAPDEIRAFARGEPVGTRSMITGVPGAVR